MGRAQKKENDLKNLPDLSRDNDNVCVSCSGHSLPHLVISGLCRERGTLQLLVGILAELLLRPEGGKHCRQATQSNNHVILTKAAYWPKQHTDQNSILTKTAYWPKQHTGQNSIRTYSYLDGVGIRLSSRSMPVSSSTFQASQ